MKKYLWMPSVAVVIGALRVNPRNSFWGHRKTVQASSENATSDHGQHCLLRNLHAKYNESDNARQKLQKL